MNPLLLIQAEAEARARKARQASPPPPPPPPLSLDPSATYAGLMRAGIVPPPMPLPAFPGAVQQPVGAPATVAPSTPTPAYADAYDPRLNPSRGQPMPDRSVPPAGSAPSFSTPPLWPRLFPEHVASPPPVDPDRMQRPPFPTPAAVDPDRMSRGPVAVSAPMPVAPAPARSQASPGLPMTAPLPPPRPADVTAHGRSADGTPYRYVQTTDDMGRPVWTMVAVGDPSTQVAQEAQPGALFGFKGLLG